MTLEKEEETVIAAAKRQREDEEKQYNLDPERLKKIIYFKQYKRAL